MNWEQIIRNSESVNELICTGYSPGGSVPNNVLCAVRLNVNEELTAHDRSYSQVQSLQKHLRWI